MLQLGLRLCGESYTAHRYMRMGLCIDSDCWVCNDCWVCIARKRVERLLTDDWLAERGPALRQLHATCGV